MTIEMFGPSPAVLHSTPTPRKHHGRSPLTLGITAGAALAPFAGGMGATASAAPGGTTVGSVEVTEGITLTGLNSFDLAGIPTETAVTTPGEMSYNVVTHSPTGHTVKAQAELAILTPTGGSLDTIPIGVLSARDVGTAADFTAVSTSELTVHTQDLRSDAAGDNLSTDLQMLIPNVTADTDTVTLDYIAATK